MDGEGKIFDQSNHRLARPKAPVAKVKNFDSTIQDVTSRSYCSRR